MSNTKTQTNNQLLIRIDERVIIMTKELAELKALLVNKVNDDDEYREMKRKVNKLWDDRSRVVGYLTAASVGGGASVVGLLKLLENFL